MRATSFDMLERLQTLSRLKSTKVLTWRGCEWLHRHISPPPRLIEFSQPDTQKSPLKIFVLSGKATNSRRKRESKEKKRREKKEGEKGEARKTQERYPLTSSFYRKRIISAVIYIDRSSVGAITLPYIFSSAFDFFVGVSPSHDFDVHYANLRQHFSSPERRVALFSFEDRNDTRDHFPGGYFVSRNSFTFSLSPSSGIILIVQILVFLSLSLFLCVFVVGHDRSDR